MEVGIRRAGILLAFLVVCLLQFSTASAQTCNGDANSMSLDDDGDGYKNGDETQNGADKCSSGSVPLDFDHDFTSDLLDPDDDNDGIPDHTDKFAQDANNGSATSIPVVYKFAGEDNGGIQGSGFTGLMCNNTSDYMSLYSMADISIGGASQKFKIDNIPANDAREAINNQKNAFQFGVKTGAFPFSFVVNGRVMAPFSGYTANDFRSMGIFLGNGDQENYLKIVCASNGGAGGIEIVKEDAGVVSATMYNVSILGSSHVNLYLTVNPSTKMVQPAYSVGGGSKIDLGPQIAVPASWISNVMAAGIISTSRGATPFTAAWDYIAVQPVDGNGNWVNINTSNTCTARHENAFVQAGNRFYLLGGRGAGKQVNVYNYSSKSWTNAPAPPIQLHHFQAVELNGLIYVVCAFTGDFPNETAVPSVYIFDPNNNTWYLGMDIPEARRRGSAGAVAYNGKIYVVGGLTNGHTGGWVSYVDVFDPRTNTWTALPDAPHARDHFHAALKGDKIYAIGGRNTGANGSTYAETVEKTDVYDISEQTWITLASPEGDIPTPRAGHMVAAIGDEIFAFGGESMSQTSAHNETEALDVQTNTWRTVDNMNTGRHSTQAVVSNFGVYVAAGAGSRGMTPELNTVEAFYPYGTTTPTGTAYTKGPFQLSMSSIGFGNVNLGTSSTKTLYLKNTSGTQALLLRGISLSGGTNFSYSFAHSTPIVINAGDSVPVNVTFTPASLGSKTGTMSMQNSGSNGGNVIINMTGVGQSGQNSSQGYLTAVPGVMNFPVTDPNVISAPMVMSLTNTGGANVTITGVTITGTNAVNFVHTFNDNGMILGVGSTTTFNVTFNPFSSGAKNATMQVTFAGSNSPLSIPLSGTGSQTAASCGYWVEKNGLLVMEIESAPASEGWTSEKAYPNYTGSEYYTWTGPNYFHEKGHGMLTYQFKINNPGKYRFKMRTRQPGPLNTHNNDVWVRFPDHGCTFEKNGQVQSSASGWWKQWQNNVGVWTYNTWAGESTFWEVYVEFPFAGVYTMDISGRAQFYSMDRIVFYKMDMMSDWAATASNPPASAWEDCPAEPRVWYRDADRDYYGSPTDSVISVAKPGVGYVWNKLDCDDDAGTVYPGAPELLDGKDNDCDGIKDEGAYLTALAINTGGSKHNSISGEIFESDRLFTTPSNPKYYNGIGDVLNTDDDALYKSERVTTTTNNFSYNFKAHPGLYTVTLYFAEVSTVTSPGQRVFNVQVEDSMILKNFDIIATAGYKTAYSYTYNLHLTDSVLNVKFIDVVGKAKISALKVAQKANTPPTFTLNGTSTFNEDFAGTQTMTVVPAAVPAHEAWQTVTYSLTPASVAFANVSINSATGQISFSSIPNMVGQQSFTVTANDGYASNNIATKTFTLKVNAVNDAPDFTLSGSLNLNEDFAGTQTVSVTPAAVPADEQSQVVTYTLSPASVSFANVSFSSATGQVSITAMPDLSGSQVFTVTANDGQSANNTVSKTFTLTVNAVNDAPVMNAIADMAINEDAAIQVVVLGGISAGVNETQTISVSAVSDNVSLIAHPSVSYTSPGASGSLSFMPVANRSGVAKITVTVSDGNLSFNREFTVTVHAVNDAPEFTVSNIIVDEDFSGAEHASVTPGFIPADEMSQVVTYSLSPATVSFANLSINSATGEITVSAIANANGSAIITVTANDGQGQNNIATQSFMLKVEAVNDAPAFTLSGDITVVEGVYTSATETVIPALVPADEQGQVVTYSISPASVSFANVSINSATGEVTITPIDAQFGAQEFTITANDGQLQHNTYSDAFTLTVEEGNNAPSFVLNGDVTVNEDFAGTQQVIVTPDAVRPHEATQVVTYSLSPASVNFANISFDSNTGAVMITSIADEHGTQQFTITADDHQNRNNTYTQTFMLTVNSVNDAPAFALSGDVVVHEDFATAEQVDIVAGFVPADEMGQVVTYSLSPASVAFANVSINSSTGVVTINAVADASGSQQFTITASDDQGAAYSADFMLVVHAVNDQPTLNAISNPGAVLEDSGVRTISLSGISAGGNESQPLTVSVTSDNPSLLYMLNWNYVSPAATGSITFQPAVNQWGAATITVTVSDGQASVVRTFVITVNSVNDEPKFIMSENSLVLDEDFAGTHTVSVMPSVAPADEASQVVTYSLSPMSVPFADILFNTATGEIQIAAVADASGSRTFTVMADDGQSQNNVHYETFVLTVNAVNDVPVFTVTPATSVFKNFTSTVTFSVNPGAIPADELSQPVTYSLSPASVSFANVALNTANGTVTITSINNMVGSQQFTLTANDQQSVNNQHAEQFLFSVVDTNYQPTLDAIADVSISEDAGMQTTGLTGITAGFNEVQHITVTAISDNPALIPDPLVTYTSADLTGTLSFAPAANQSGVAVITVKVDDGQSFNSAISRSFTVTVNAVNDVPVMDMLTDLTIHEDAGLQTIMLSGISAGAGESQPLTITAISDNASLIANPAVIYSSPASSATLQFAPAANQHGSALITVTANDGQLSVSESFTVTVLSVNDAPVLSPVLKLGQEDKSIGLVAGNFTDKFTDIDGDAMTKIQVVTLPVNGSLLLNSNAVNLMDEIALGDINHLVYKPADEFSGADSFMWNGFDGQVYAAMNAPVRFNLIDANDKPFIVSPLTDVTVNEDAAAMLNYADLATVFNDFEDGGNMTYSVNNSNQLLLGVTVGADHFLDITFNENAHGTATVIITATDHIGAYVADTFSVTVNSVEDAPSVFTLLTPASGSVLADPSAIHFTWQHATDGDGDEVTYALTIRGDQLDTTVSAHSVNEMLFNGTSLFTMDETYTWFVTASDGDDETVSAASSFKFSVTAVHDPSVLVSAVEAYPNPFSTRINIGYALKADSKVTVTIYNFMGQRVETIADEEQEKGDYKFVWNSEQAAGGIYFFEVTMKTKSGMQGSYISKIVKQ